MGSILFPVLRLWFSISRQGWSLEQEHSRAPARTPAPPHHEQPAGPAVSPKWKPSQRSKKKRHTLALNKHNLALYKDWDRPEWKAVLRLQGLTWSLIPVAMWPTFTRRVSLIRMLFLLKSRMQTSTPEPITEQRYTWRKRKGITQYSFVLYYVVENRRDINVFYFTFKTAGSG